MITVNVAQKHIDNGNPCRADSCPIALALQELYPKYNVWVWCHYIRFWPKDIVEPAPEVIVAEIITPLPASVWLHKFDTNENCKPFSFRLEVPDGL